MEKPPELVQYQDLKKKADEIDRQLKSLRPKVLKILEQGEFEDIYSSKATTIKYDEDLILQWVKESYAPEIFVNVTDLKLCWESFESMVRLGTIDISKLPEGCYKESTITKILERKIKNEDQM